MLTTGRLLLAAFLLPLGACATAAADGATPQANAFVRGTADTTVGVGLLVVRDGDDTVLRSCTATLIDETHVVTAGECGRADVNAARHPECAALQDCCQSLVSSLTRLSCDFVVTSTVLGVDACRVYKDRVCGGESIERAGLRTEVTFDADAANATWTRATGVVETYAVGDASLLVFALAEKAPVAPLPIAHDHLSPSASWSEGRVVGYGPTELAWFGNDKATPRPRNTTAGKIEGVDAETITVGAEAAAQNDVGGPFLMKIGGVDTVVGIGASSAGLLGVRLVFARTDALGDALTFAK